MSLSLSDFPFCIQIIRLFIILAGNLIKHTLADENIDSVWDIPIERKKQGRVASPVASANLWRVRVKPILAVAGDDY